MAYLPSAQSSPWAGTQWVNTEPDLNAVANIVGNLGQQFAQVRQQDADRALEMYQIQTASNQQTANNMLNYLGQIRQNRMEESRQAMEMLRLSSEMKEMNYQMEQARKLDDMKWQARDARAQLFPLLSEIESRTQNYDLLSANDLMRQAFRIPGVTDDETSIRLLNEYNSRLNSFKIGDKPAIQVLNSLKSEAMSNFGSASWDKLRSAMRDVSGGSNPREVAQRFVAEMGAPAGQAAKIESFLQKGTNIASPEDAARMKQFEMGLQEAYLRTVAERMGDPTFDADEAMSQMLEMKERGRQLMMYGDYSYFRSSEHPTMDYDAINNLVKPVQNRVNSLKGLFDTIRENATTRAAFLQGRSLTDTEITDNLIKKNPQAYQAYVQMLRQRNPNISDKDVLKGVDNPQQLKRWFTSEEGLVRKLDNDLSQTTSQLLGVMSKIDSNPQSVTQGDLQNLYDLTYTLDSMLSPYYGAGAISADLFNKYGVKNIIRQIRKNSQAEQAGQSFLGGGGMSGMGTTIPSTPAPETAIPFDVR